jgi:hypothetical protein
LIRRGNRPIASPQIPIAPYRITVTRANHRVEVWTIQMQEPLPTIPIPLLAPDADIPLDLSEAIQQVYQKADYDLTIDYSRQPPPPPLSETERQLLHDLRQ